jgi:ribosomal protein S27E
LPNPEGLGYFKGRARAPTEARVSLTVTAARVICYLEVRCAFCGARLFDVPADAPWEVRLLDGSASGDGLVVRCRRCGKETEVVRHSSQEA